MYSLLGESGDLHPPKDSNRNEIALTTQEEHDIRAQVLSDAMALAQRGAPLSPAWYRQLGDGAAAQMAEARLDNLSTAPAPAAGKRRRWDTYEVEAIVNEERGWYLVRWAGYHPSWEAWRTSGAVGSPVETWEQGRYLMNTEAMRAWRG